MLKSWIVQEVSFLVTLNHRIRFALKNGTVFNKNLLVGLFDSAKKLCDQDISKKKNKLVTLTTACSKLSHLSKIKLHDTK